jgi:hypothetical protein
MKADACANSICNKEARKFRNNVYKINNYKATIHVNSISGITGVADICSLWEAHFEPLYSTGVNSKYSDKYVMYSSECSAWCSRLCQFTTNSVVHAVNQQKLGKAAGPDGVFMEAFLYGGQRLYLYLSVANVCIYTCLYYLTRSC